MNKSESLKFAIKFIRDTISFFGENIDVTGEIQDDIISLHVESSEINSILIGRNAETLHSLQYLVGSILRSKDAEISRVNLDIANYKQQREERMAEQAREWIIRVQQTGNSHVAHLNAADRRVVHRVASEFDDIHTHSEGEGRERRIIIAQASS